MIPTPPTSIVKDWVEFGHRFVIEPLDPPLMKGASLRYFRLWHADVNCGDPLSPCGGGQWQYTIESAEHWAGYVVQGSYINRIIYLENLTRTLERQVFELRGNPAVGVVP